MKPKDLFVGVTDLFAVFLPGAVLAYLSYRVLLRLFPDSSVAVLVRGLESTPSWIALFVGAYLLGHILFSFSARLDDAYDNKWRASRIQSELGKLVHRVRLHQLAVVGARFPEGEQEPLDDQPRKLPPWVRLVDALGIWTWSPPQPRAGDYAINKFKLARAILQIQQPAALEEVTRLEADSKFFRSAVLLLLIVVVTLVGGMGLSLWAPPPNYQWLGFAGDTVATFVCLVLLRFCYGRYCEQRRKSVELAYQLLLMTVARST